MYKYQSKILEKSVLLDTRTRVSRNNLTTRIRNWSTVIAAFLSGA